VCVCVRTAFAAAVRVCALAGDYDLPLIYATAIATIRDGRW